MENEKGWKYRVVLKREASTTQKAIIIGVSVEAGDDEDAITARLKAQELFEDAKAFADQHTIITTGEGAK